MKKILTIPKQANVNIKESSTKDIAIIGISLKLADYEDTENFWEDLVSAKDRIRSIPEQRKKDADDILRFMGQDPEQLRYREIAYLDRVDEFDYRFFHLSPKEAEIMSPNQRLFMQTAWKALEDAGYGGMKLKGAKVGVFMGMSSAHEYGELAGQIYRDDSEQIFLSNVPSNTATRLSFVLDWRGPALMVDTACSSSLTAVHLACRSLRANECKLALVGTVKTAILPVALEKVEIESSDGRTRTFDNASDGTGGGEGVIAVLLKPLNQALKDEDSIYAVIKGSALNQDGTAAGMTVPNADAQAELIDQAWKDAGIDPRTLRFIEAHGTGTKLGDPIEIDGINKAFVKYTDDKHFCAVGSVKTNFGHLDHAAGLIGLVKAALSLQKKKIPPLAHFKKANSKIPFENSPVFPADRLIDLSEAEQPLLCGVSAFGLSGVNCHVVMEEAPAPKQAHVPPKVFHRFEKKRCWLKVPAAPYATNRDAVFIKQALVETPGQVIYEIGMDSGEDWLLNEHKAGGQTCLVGAAYFQLLSEIAKKQGYKSPLEVNELFWENLLAISPEEIRTSPDKLIATLKASSNGHAVSILRKQTTGAWMQYATAEIKTAPEQAPTRLDIEQIKARCEAIKLSENGFGNGNHGLVEVGRRWDCLEKIWKNDNERLTLLKLKDEFKADLNRFEFHPPLLDAALSSGLTEPGFLPIMSGSAKLYRPISGEIYSYVKGKSESKEIQKYDVVLADADGQISAEFHGLTFKRVQNECQLLSAVWLPKQQQYSQTPGEVCVLGHFQPLQGIQAFDIPRSEDERLALIQTLEKQQIGKIIYSPSLPDRDCASLEELETRLDLGVINLFRLVKTLIKHDGTRPLEILVIGKNTYAVTNSEAHLNPENAALSGLAKVIHCEYDNIACKFLDLDDVTTGEQVLAELTGFDSPARSAAYRNGIRYEQDFQAIQSSGTAIEIKEEGVYLITGGLGGMGMEFAKDLAAKKRVKLALIGRSGLPPREEWAATQDGKVAEKINAILAMEASGSTVLVIAADVSDPVQMEQAINETREKLGNIDGVLHCAGIAGDGYLFRKEEETFTNVLRPKIQGTWLLDRLTREDSPDFFILCSALSAVTGSAGQGDYIAANAYQDAFAAFRNKQGLRTLSINWPAWKETGMAFDWQANQSQYALTTKEAIDLLHKLFAYEGSQAVIVPPGFSLQDAFQSSKMGERTETQANVQEQPATVILSGRDDGNYSPVEIAVAQAWAEVLGYDEINVLDDYYSLGGDSIDANKISNMVAKKLGTKISMEVIFSHPTIEKYAAFIAKKSRESESRNAIEVVEKQLYYPASAAQRRLYILWELSKQSLGYNLPSILFIENSIENKVDVGQLARAFDKLIARHESLRVSFEMKDGQLVQLIADHVDFKLSEIALKKSELDTYGRKFSRPFDLAEAPLLRAEVATLDTGEQVLLFDVHHIVADAFSLQIIFQELNAFYKNENLPELKIQYKDFARWQNAHFESEAFKVHQDYWLKQFEQDIPVLDFPYDFQRPPVITYEGAVLTFSVDEDLLAKVRNFSAKNETTPFMVFLSAFYLLFHKYSRQEDIIIAIADLGRNAPEVSETVGMFINHLAIRAFPKDDKTPTEFLAEVKDLMVNAYVHQEYPFDQLVQKLNLPRDMSRDPLTGITFSYMNFKQPEQDESGLQFRPYEGQVKASSKFDMAIFGTEFPDKIDFAIEYYSAVLSESTMQQFGARFLKILGELVGEEAKIIADIDVLTAEGREKILVDFNRTDAPYPADQCVHEFFEAQAEKTPDAMALVFGGKSISYSELNSLANQTARHLQGMGVGPEVLVGVCMQRSIEMIVGMLGILKAGGAYLPLDPEYPAERLAFMVEDAQILVLLTQSRLTETLPSTQAQVLCMDSAIGSLRQLNPSNIQSGVKPDNLSYVIYTSGSTGKPKGVAINHLNTAAFIAWSQTVFSAEELAGVAATTSICFDLSVFEIFVPLSVGGSIILLENALQLPDLPADANVTLLNTVPSVINELVKLNLIPASVQVVNLAGEALKNDLVQRVYRSDTIKKVYNLYGPTEDTTYSTFALMKKGDTEAPLIGRPIDNTQAFILDNNCRPVPIGVAGELYLGGAGLARGYLNRPEMTAERFIDNPFGEAGTRLYKTGDLARFLLDGNIQYLGRLDNQVKIRGFRIEIPEIEATLGKYPAIAESAVLALENSDRKEKTLVAYIVADNNLDLAELRKFLNKWLPNHMVPSSFVLLDAMPLTPNGKMDRCALEAMGGNSGAPENHAVMPQTELEGQIAGLWKKILQVEKVGIHDNFFEVGGHSLLLLQLQQELQAVLGKRPPIADLFHYPTIHAFAAHLSGGTKAPESTAPLTTSATNDIAVIGMAGRFPGANDVDSFWKNVCGGVESISFFSEQELLAEGIDPALLNNPAYVKANGILEGIEFFDAAFFGFSPREAEIMDPQQRLFMECAAAAIEHAGYDTDRINRPVGVFAGAGINTYYMDNLAPHRELLQSVGDYQLMVSNQNDFITTRTSYKLNLKGPSVNIQTACSTSLVAVHMACQSLLNGECDMALAGGVSIKANQKRGYLYEDGMILSPDGHCRAFDAGARGTVGGNGVGIVMLKKLDRAIADKDCIHGVIKGSAINNDGVLKAGYTAPSVAGQAEVIARAMRGIDPETVSYVETHGTGTAMGDPIEIAALTQAYQAHTRKKQFCAIGSVKTNIGHLDAAAGVAGLIKTIQALKHKSLPPSLHFEKPNPEIDFAGSPFYVNSKQAKWTSEGMPRRAGVSSFGIGGTNAHVVLEEAPEAPPASHEPRPQVLLLSARTESALEKATANLAEHFRQNPGIDLADAAFTLNTGRKVFKHRRMLVCRTVDEAVKTLMTANGLLNRKCESDGHPVVFLFSGQGSQYVNMASGLYAEEPIFREQVDLCANILTPLMGLDIREILYPDNGATEQKATGLEQTAVAQPALFVIEYALSQLWMAWGIQPVAMLGHSIGEYVAACLAGVFSLEQALELVALRGRLMQSLPAGAMLSVVLSEQQIQPYLSPDISLAAVNAPALCVVSGPTEAIEALENRLAVQDIQSIRLHTSHAFHSAMMEPILPAFVDCLKKMELKAPQKPYISNLSGDWITAGQATDPNYWAQHLRSAVRFTDGMETLLKDPESVFLEVGPGRVLTTLVKRHSPSTGEPETVSSLPSPKDPVDDHQVVLAALGKLWLAGTSVDWFAVHEPMQPSRIAMPTYPFERQRYWIDGKEAQDGNSQVPQNKREKLPDWFYLPSWKILAPLNIWLEEEQIPEPASWLLFVDDCGLGDSLAEQLERLGQAVVTVKTGKEWRQLSDNAYVLNPETAEDYETLLEALSVKQNLPQTIVHLWSVNRGNNGGMEAEITAQAQTMGFYSLLFLAQALGKQQQSPLELIAVSNNMQAVTGEELLQPEKATLLGPVRTIPQEYPNIQCRSVDVALPIENTESEQRLLEQMLAEILSKTDDRAIAYRGKHRWLPSYEPVHLEQAKAKKRSLLKQQGNYLITGGLGGIGLTLAEYLGKNFSANLILISRSAFPEPKDWTEWLESHDAGDETSLKIQALQTLENQGARLWIAQADAANLQQMQDVVAKADERFGPIHGVIHAAGLPGGGVIQRKTPEIAASILAPKVDGSVVLHTLFKDAKLDFVLLCSSLSAIFEAFGQVDYCAANAFLDAYANYLRAQGMPAISLNWDLWREVGMAVKTATPDSLRERREQEMRIGITPEEGREVFRLVMECALTRLVVSTQKLETRLEQAKAADFIVPEPNKADSAMRMHSRPELSSPLTLPRSNIELSLANIWQKLLGIEPIGVLDDFFELGGDSLLAIGLISKIKEKLNKELSTASLYQASTVEKQAILLMGQDDSLPWSPLVDIQPEGSKPPLFCVHPAGGHAICYYDLSRCLDKDQPFYGLQACGLEEGQEPYATAEEMASFYLKTIKEHFPHGPYRLAGWSFGGLIAFELAQQFRAQWDEVAFLALFDTQLSDTLTGAQLTEEDSAEILVNVMSEMIPDLSLEELRALEEEEEQLHYVMDKALEVGFFPPGTDFMVFKRLWDVLITNRRIIQTYIPKNYEGKVSFFQATELGKGLYVKTSEAWKQFVGQGLDLHIIPGNHYNMVSSPQVEVLAGKLTQCMKRISESSPNQRCKK